MSIPGNANPLLLASAAEAAAAPDVATRSLRFNSGDSANLTRTFTNTEQKKFTVSFWVKRSTLGTSQRIYSGNTNSYIMFNTSDQLHGNSRGTGSTNAFWYSTRVFRDVGAWYHIVVAYDMSQSAFADKLKVYVNGELETLTGSLLNINQHSGGTHYIGTRAAATMYLDAYLADFYYIGGAQLDATSFGAFNSSGVWQAAEYDGTYGTNGARLKFDDASSDITLGKDSSGNSNTWTVNNITAKAPGKKGSHSNFDAVLWTGNGSSQSIKTPFSPDLVWIKGRSTAANHNLFDSLRGRAALFSNLTNAEQTFAAGKDFDTLTSDGFTLLTPQDTAINNNNETFVAWAWNAGANSDKTYTVKVVSDSGNKYRFDDFGTSAVTLDLAEGSTYVFDQSDSSNSGHPLRFSTTSDGTHNSGSEYTTGVTTTGTPGSAGAKTTIVVAASAPTLYYYCSSHSGMGGQANTNDTEGASNFDGNTQSIVKANQDYGFSIATISSVTGSSSLSFGHGLGAQPNIIIQKSRTNTYGWQIYAKISGSYKYLSFSGDAASSTTTANMGITPTSSTVGLGSNFSASNSYVYYSWTEISGFSKFSTYTGTGSSHNVDCGFKPAFVMVKCTSSSNCNWHIFDNHRGTERLVANLNSNQGSPAAYAPTFTDTGFTVANVSDTHTNASGQTYFFMAFAATRPGENDDSVFDVPTNGSQSDTGSGGEVSGCYATLNPLVASHGYSDGNLNFTFSTTGNTSIPPIQSTIAMPSGKWYAEVTIGSGATGIFVGLWNSENFTKDHLGSTSDSYAYWSNTGNKYNNDSNSSYGDSFTEGDVIGIAFDADGGNLYFYKNGVAQNSGTAAYTGITSRNYVFAAHKGTTGTDQRAGKWNFGQREFHFDAPSGYKALCTTNLATPTIADGSDYFDTKLYTGSGVARSITGYEFSPDWVWLKRRSATSNHLLFDIIRGTEKVLESDTTDAEATVSGSLTAFNSDGFSLGTSSGGNNSGAGWVAWAWDAGSSTVSNTDGTITSSVRANQTAGFSIVSWTGTGANATIGHGLNADIGTIIVKRRTGGAASWPVWHSTFVTANTGDYLFLDATDTKGTGNYAFWNNTAPTSSVFSVSSNANLNNNGDPYIAYCFSPVANYSQFGSYEGNGSTDGPFVHTGFRPAWLMFKRTDTANSWMIYDAARNTFNVIDNLLKADSSNAETSVSGSDLVDFLSNGFKIREDNAGMNASGGTYAYMCLAENPFQANGGLAR